MKVGILGNGITSLALAKALVNRRVYVDHIFDKKNNIINKIRTIGVTKSNFDFVNENILNISKIGWKIKKIEIFNEKFKDKNLLVFENKKKELFSIIKNYQFYNLLRISLKNKKFYKEKNFLSNIKDYHLIINCDNNHSITKKKFNKKIEKNYQSYAYTTIIKHKKILDNSNAIQIFTNLGPIAFLPVSESETSIVYSVRKIFKLKDNEIIELIKKYNPKYSIVKIDKVQNFKLISSNLRSYHYKNVLAFGDLLHKIHPLAGQGFNMTIRDINQLLKIIINKIELGLQIDNSVCLEFEKKVKHKNYLFSSSIDLVYEFFNLESKIKKKNLSKLVQFLGKNKSINKLFTKFANNGSIIENY